MRGPLDLRLVPAAAAGWGGALIGTHGVGMAGGWVVLAAAGGLAVWCRAGPRRWAAVAALTCLACGWLAGAAAHTRQQADPLYRLLAPTDRINAQVSGTITRTWRPVAGGSHILQITLDQADLPEAGTVATALPATLVTSLRPTRVPVGALVRGRVVLSASEDGRLIGRLTGPLSVLDVPLWARGRAAMLERARAAWGEAPGSALALAVTFGAREELDPVTVRALARSGLAHLTAVSGLHVGLVAGTLWALTGRVRLRPRVCLTAGALAGYLALIGPAGSVIRAGGMAACVLAALVLHRPGASQAALAAVCLGAVLAKPAWAADIGFALSAAATLAIVLGARRLADTLVRHRLPRRLAEAVAVSTLATAATTPLALVVRPEIPLLAVPANVLAAPLVAPGLLGALAIGVLAALSPAAAHLFVPLAGLPLRAIEVIAEHLQVGVPWLPGVPGVVLAAVLIVSVGYLIHACEPVRTLRNARRYRTLTPGRGEGR